MCFLERLLGWIVVGYFSLPVFGQDTGSCFSSDDKVKWNRTFNFNNRSLVLKLAVTDEPAHRIVNYLFQLLAYERLGYKEIEFVKLKTESIRETINRVRCQDESCTRLPEVHLNLLLWLPIGVDVNYWVPPSAVTDHGPLGPTRQWELLANPIHSNTADSINRLHSHLPSSCAQRSLLSLDEVSALIHRDFYSNSSADLRKEQPVSYANQSSGPTQVYEWELVNDTVVTVNAFTWHRPPSLCTDAELRAALLARTGSSQSLQGPDDLFSPTGYCRTESYQAVKIAWAMLNTASPQLAQLASRMHLSNQEFNALVAEAGQAISSMSPEEQNDKSRDMVYRDIACRWLRRHATRWKGWTVGWDQKLNLTVAGMFSMYGSWILSGLKETAESAVSFVNRHPDYFLNTEYALRLDVRNLSCTPGLVLSDYFRILAEANDKRLIGSIAALCSDSIEAVVELANFRKKLIVSPTVATARFLGQQHYPYFFRTVPSLAEVNCILVRLFLSWGWKRMVVFRKVDHFFNPRLFQAKGIEIIADIEMQEDQLSYEGSKHTLKKLKQRNSRIFVVEYGVRGTYLTLCAAYHQGMHFGGGYVWFLNPWLPDRWWLSPITQQFSYCTAEQMLNITSWTFTVGHQFLIGPVLHSQMRLQSPHTEPEKHDKSASNNLDTSFRHSGNKSHTNGTTNSSQSESRRRIRRASVNVLNTNTSSGTGSARRPSSSYRMNRNESKSSGRLPPAQDPMRFYSIYTEEAVIVLASAMVQLLKENPSAVSALDQPAVAEAFRNHVSRTHFAYRMRSVDNPSPKGEKRDDVNSSAEGHGFGDFGFQRAGDFYGISATGDPLNSQLRFNKLNERVADYWLLKQRQRHTTVPLFVWSTKTSRQLNMTDAACDFTKESPAKNEDYLIMYDAFLKRMDERQLDQVDWSVLGHPPHDGSATNEVCALYFLSDTLRMGCTGATVFVAVMVCAVFFIPVILLSLHYRRKLREAEQLTRKPFEELCAELADLDIPPDRIVLNRQIGQGAFGLVFGGEAKTNGKWEAVAVKVTNVKATYEGKTDFLSEAKLMRSLKHGNVVRLIGVSLGSKDNLYLIMELMLLGDLKTYLLSRRIFAQRSPEHEDIRPSTLTSMSIDIAQGVSYLHSKHLRHRDIACRNCLVGSDHVVKIGDFGLTREAAKNSAEGYYKFTRNCELPIRWMSPEALQFGIFSVQSDIWSYGITLYEIITFGVFPYNDMDDVEVVERVKRRECSITEFLPHTAVDTVVWHLIRQCCQHDWKSRPSSMEQVLDTLKSHPECIRPFLTDDPPKPITMMDSLQFQPSVGTCLISDTTMPGFVVTDSVAGGFRNIRSSSATAVPVPDNLSWHEDEEDNNDEREEDRVRVEFSSTRASSRPSASTLQKSSPNRTNLASYYSDSEPTETFTLPSRDPIRFRGPSVPACPVKRSLAEDRFPRFAVHTDAGRSNTEGMNRMDQNFHGDEDQDENEDHNGCDSRLPLLSLSTTSSNLDPQVSGPVTYKGLEAALGTEPCHPENYSPGIKQENSNGVFDPSEQSHFNRKYPQGDQSFPDMSETEPNSMVMTELLPLLSSQSASDAHCHREWTTNASKPGGISTVATENRVSSGTNRSTFPNVQFHLDTPDPNSTRSRSFELLLQPMIPDINTRYQPEVGSKFVESRTPSPSSNNDVPELR
ncbi:Guanylate cyclase [Fasciola gigantica]|uniref:Guanylate cyclase n=1 Tax=Fasciola gigantica TaxID=46835 RepID=A0A504YI85_FASGI|nr:Guanylate cyclase [Fasciola gigantica]